MKRKIALLAIFVNMILSASKIFIGLISHSTAVLAAGLDSFVDIFASAISYIGIKISGKPADEKHPYGHYKFEVMSGSVITLLVLATGIGIIYDAVKNFYSGSEVSVNYLAYGVMVFSVIINIIMSYLKIHYGKKENSISLLSDGVHSKIDVYTSSAILIGLFFIPYWVYADSVLAILIGIFIIKEAFSLGREAVGSLLDVSAGQEMEDNIKALIAEDNIEVNSIKTQKKGSAVTANIEIKLQKDLTVDEAAKISNNLRRKLIDKIDSLQYVAIQIASHDIKTSYYKADFGKSYGWQTKGRFRDKVTDAQGKGPNGICVCPQCGYETAHERGRPCSGLTCPKCKIALSRK